MISEAIFDMLFGILGFLCNVLPFFNISIDFDTIQVFFDIIGSIAYLLPMDTIIDLFQITTYVMAFRVVVSTIKTLWAIIPFL